MCGVPRARSALGGWLCAAAGGTRLGAWCTARTERTGLGASNVAYETDVDAATGRPRVVLWVAGLIILLALMMEGDGAVIAMGVKAGLLAR